MGVSAFLHYSVTAALQIVDEVKTKNEPCGMSDLLTKATQMAMNIIQDHLNRM